MLFSESGNVGDLGIIINEGSNHLVFENVTLFNDTWTHAVGTYDGETLKVYINGELAGVNTAPSGPITAGSADLCIGAEPPASGCPLGSSSHFDGSIDDILVFSRALSSQQVKALYENSTNFIAKEETLLGELWRVDVTPNSGAGSSDGPTQQSNGMPIMDDANLTVSDTETDCNVGVLIAGLFTNTSGTIIVGATCNVTFDGDATVFGMSFNGSHYINDTKTFPSGGVVDYNVTCSHTSYFAEQANDTVTITGETCDAIAAIPEFSTVGLMLAVIVIGLASVFIIRKKRQQ